MKRKHLLPIHRKLQSVRETPTAPLLKVADPGFKNSIGPSKYLRLP